MGQLIRDLMAKADGFQMLAGHIEADEAYIGGHRPRKRGGVQKVKQSSWV